MVKKRRENAPVSATGTPFASRSVSFSEARTSELSHFRVFSYGVGHVYNDLCSAMWFTYLLVFLVRVLKFDSTSAGLILLIGQITDGISTPIVGLESDRVGLRFIQRYGQRKSWHLFGTIFVTLSFPFLFMRCPGCSINTSELSMMIFYIPCVMMFQIGWASVQISHLAMIPELSNTSHDRIKLNSIRYAFTVLANLLVFGVCAVILGMDQVKQTSITPHDERSFKLLGLIIVGLGLVFASIFHLCTHEAPSASLLETSAPDRALYTVLPTNDSEKNAKTWRDWIRDARFYQIAVIYTCARLLVNVTQTYLPFWLLETEHFQKEFIAIVPLIVYTSSFLTSSAMSLNVLSPLVARRRSMLGTGFGVAIGASVWMYWHQLHNRIFGVAVLIGAASAIVLVTSLAMTADMIGRNSGSGAFVYGAMSFCDKISSGVTIQIVQYLEHLLCESCKGPVSPRDWFYQNVIVFVPGCAALIGLGTLASYLPRLAQGRRLTGRWTDEVVDTPAHFEDPVVVRGSSFN